MTSAALGDRPGLLIVDDEFSVRDALYNWFRKDGYRVVAADSAAVALSAAEEASFDVVLLDLRMPGMDGLELQRRLRVVAPDSVVIVVTAYGSVDTAVLALKQGAFDYVTKPVDPDELGRIVHKALEHRRLKWENARLRTKLEALGSVELVGESPQMAAVMRLVDSLAGTDVTVLIRGESGTGKELVARAVHDRGRRRDGPLVAVNCGALPESLLESELFGHERGAFTGAEQRRKGKIEQADGGTLFLDEVGTIAARTQIDLLRVLDSKEFTRIGGSRALRSDFRVVCATNQDLEQLVADKLFREDLYFRVNVFRIDLPPLRERTGDVAVLAKHFLRVFALRADKEFTGFEASCLSALQAHAWPGNVRELAHAIERGVIVGEPPLIRLTDLTLSSARVAPASSPPPGDTLAEVEKAHVARIVRRTGGNISQAARILEVDRVTLYNKLKKYGLSR